MLNVTTNYAQTKARTAKLQNPVQKSPGPAKTGNLPKDTVSFKGKTYPSGWYSKWFIEQESSQLKLSAEEHGKWVKGKLDEYRGLLDEKMGVSEKLSKIKQEYVELREGDHKALRKDLSEEQKLLSEYPNLKSAPVESDNQTLASSNTDYFYKNETVSTTPKGKHYVYPNGCPGPYGNKGNKSNKSSTSSTNSTSSSGGSSGSSSTYDNKNTIDGSGWRLM